MSNVQWLRANRLHAPRTFRSSSIRSGTLENKGLVAFGDQEFLDRRPLPSKIWLGSQYRPRTTTRTHNAFLILPRTSQAQAFPPQPSLLKNNLSPLGLARKCRMIGMVTHRLSLLGVPKYPSLIFGCFPPGVSWTREATKASSLKALWLVVLSKSHRPVRSGCTRSKMVNAVLTCSNMVFVVHHVLPEPQSRKTVLNIGSPESPSVQRRHPNDVRISDTIMPFPRPLGLNRLFRSFQTLAFVSFE